MSGPERPPSPASRLALHVLRLILSAAAVAFLWIAVDYLLSFQQHASESFHLEVGRWVPVLSAAIGAGLLFGIAMALPLGRGYRPLRVVVLGLPPAVFLAQFVFKIWWAFPRQWKPAWWLDWPHLFFSPSAQVALGVLFGLALAAGFRIRGEAYAEEPAAERGPETESTPDGEHDGERESFEVQS